TTELPTCWSLPQAPITNGSLTDTQTTLSTPLARRSSARSTKPGRWWSEQVGVKAPGNPKSTTLPWPKTSVEVVVSGPLLPNVNTFTSGTRSPTAIVIRFSFCRRRPGSGCHTPAGTLNRLAPRTAAQNQSRSCNLPRSHRDGVVTRGDRDIGGCHVAFV